MSYRFKQYWLRTNTGCDSVDFRPTDKEATSRAAKAFEASLLSRMFEVSEVYKVSLVSSPRHRWSVFGRDGGSCRVCESAGPVGWRGAHCGAVGVRGRPERTWWRAVSCSIHQVLTTVGSPMAPGSCTPGSQRRGTGLLQSDIVVF